MLDALRNHWPEYLMEAAGLGIFMISAGLFGVILFHPASAVVQALPDPLPRRILMGLAMGLTAIGIIYSPWGRQSGAHLNPAVTLTFTTLGKVAPWDAIFYILAQFVGGTTGVYAVLALLGERFAEPPVSYVATMPGGYGPWVAFTAEVIITFILMTVVLTTSNIRKTSRYTGLFAGCLVATYITIVAPISGMSMNPARSFASAFPGGLWDNLWIYFTAPPLGMLAAAGFYRGILKGHDIYCAKLNHHTSRRCIFLGCRFGDLLKGK
ncbi:MIP/aquaporin family protein [Geobacter sp.]|uniref:MIP/aquaporin family protein n=1 Tax=Geobacter sp. TaxID=46610 RepID=UPI0027B98615|nr:aquaporin [Geobacter sp.]